MPLVCVCLYNERVSAHFIPFKWWFGTLRGLLLLWVRTSAFSNHIVSACYLYVRACAYAAIHINVFSSPSSSSRYTQNGTLQEMIDKLKEEHRKTDELTALRTFVGVCAGVYALHCAAPVPLAHRDLKVNIFLTFSACVVCDFVCICITSLFVYVNLLTFEACLV